MDTAKKYIVAGFALSMVLGSVANAANKKDEDSVYQWGRWAVLSPAAGGGAPFVEPVMPAATNNIRPDETGDFVPKVLVENPVVRPPVPVQPPAPLVPRIDDNPGGPIGNLPLPPPPVPPSIADNPGGPIGNLPLPPPPPAGST